MGKGKVYSRTHRQMWVEFAVASNLAPRGFSPVFRPPAIKKPIRSVIRGRRIVGRKTV